jgi:hypothetical protein
VEENGAYPENGRPGGRTMKEVGKGLEYRLFHAQKDAKRASNHAEKGNIEKVRHYLHYVEYHLQKLKEVHEQSCRER